jgi:hypothetical protein
MLWAVEIIGYIGQICPEGSYNVEERIGCCASKMPILWEKDYGEEWQ